METGVPGYKNILKEAAEAARKNNISEGATRGIETMLEDMAVLEPLVKSEADIKRLRLDVEKLLGNLSEGCKKGEEGRTLGSIRQLRDRVRALITIWGRRR